MLSASIPQWEICTQLHIGRGVLNRYKKLADEAKVDYGTIGRMSEEQIHSLLQSPPSPKPSEQKNELKELLPDYAEDLVKNLWGYSENAVHTHLWVAIIAYQIIAKIKADYKSPYSITEVATLIRTSALERVDLRDLITKPKDSIIQNQNVKELTLFDEF